MPSCLSPKEKTIHEHGLISVLKQIHDDLDAAVFDAYGWPANLTDEQILEKIVELNKVRAEEESRGIIRYLRPDFQNPKGVSAAAQQTLDLPDAEAPAKGKKAKPQKVAWPETLAEQAKAICTVLASQAKPVTADDLAKAFARGKVERIEELLETLVSLGQVRNTGTGYVC